MLRTSCAMPCKTPEEVQQLLDKSEPLEASGCCLTAAGTNGQGAVLCSRGRGGLSQEPYGNLPLEGQPSTGEDDCNTLKKEAATVKGSLGCLPKLSGDDM